MSEQSIASRLKAFYGMGALPVEGGYFQQSYVCDQRVTLAQYGREKPLGTAILYLYDGEDADCFSALHRLPTDEVYHFYLGDPVEMLLLYPDGRSQRVILGPDVFNGQQVQFVVPAGVWQGSHLRPGGRYALAGTTMAPGYDDADYEGGERDELAQAYPREVELIRTLTRI